MLIFRRSHSARPVLRAGRNNSDLLTAQKIWVERRIQSGEIPRWLQPESYSTFLCRFQLQHPNTAARFWQGWATIPAPRKPVTPAEDAPDAEWERWELKVAAIRESRRIDETAKRKALRGYGPWLRKIMAPQGLWLARGLNNLPLAPNFNPRSLLRAQSGRDSYSLNFAFASKVFGSPSRYGAGHLADDLARTRGSRQRGVAERITQWRAYLKQQLGTVPTSSKALTKAVTALESEAMIVGKFAPANIYSWGNDSESGPLEEAEVLVRGAPMRKVGLFVASPHRLDYPLATEDERRHYCLSSYMYGPLKGEERELVLHLDGACDISKLPVKRVHTVSTPSSNKQWYRVRAPKD